MLDMMDSTKMKKIEKENFTSDLKYRLLLGKTTL